MISKTTRTGEFCIRLTKEDRAKLKPGERFVRRGEKVFIRTTIAASKLLSDSPLWLAANLPIVSESIFAS